MKPLIFILTVSFLASCTNDDILPADYTPMLADTVIIHPGEIDAANTFPVIAEYYENLSIAAQWYAKHPALAKGDKLKTPLTHNPILQKIKALKIAGKNGETCSLFELDEKTLNIFLQSWKKIEAAELSRKFRKDPSGNSLVLFEIRNSALSGKFENLKSAGTGEDPFLKVMADMETLHSARYPENGAGTILRSEGEGDGDEEYSDDSFWETVISNYNISFSMIQGAPPQLSAQTFVDRIRPSIKKGRFMLALPGGWNTRSPIVFYPHKHWYDVGHVAVFTKNANDLPEEITSDASFSIGTGVKYNTSFEQIGRAWLYKHGLAFVCQVCDVKWEPVFDENNEPTAWKKIMTDADNEAILEETSKYIGIPYCNAAEAFYSKYTVPESFICSSLVWYAVKEATGTTIDDSWGPSVYPVDIFLSENVKIIDDTLD